MPWRLICFIIIFAILLVFITLNLDNRCNISFHFVVFQNVPIYLTVFSAFALGMITSIPYIISIKLKKGRKGDGKSSKKKVLGKQNNEMDILAPMDEKSDSIPTL
ncbi:MAG: hypothetical protein LBQ88_14830 [Treponema sp.]|jgi:uncharacterized integral membrane protein|nr:hypothetical protein [Treponema sp.]